MLRNIKNIKKLSKNDKKLHIVGIVGVPGNYGGFETLVDNLLDSDELKKLDVFVYCEKSFLDNMQDFSKYKNAYLIPVNLKANGWQSIFYDLVGMITACITGGTVLILGTSATFILPLLKILSPSTNFLVNMAGLEWSRSKWNLIISKYLKFNEKMAAKFSDILIADNQGLCEYVDKNYKRNSIYIPYGGDQFAAAEIDYGVFDDYIIPEIYDFAMARSQVDNNIEIILDSYIGLERNIVFVSNWNNNEYGKNILKKYKKYENIYLIGPIYDVSKVKALHSKTMFYIHGHSAGGTNPVLVESMWSRLPIVAYDVTFNRHTTGGHALYFKDKHDLRKILKEENFESCKNNIDKMWEKTNQTYVWRKIIKSYEDIIL